LLNPISQCFSDSFKNNITQANRPKFKWDNRKVNLRDKANESVIYTMTEPSLLRMLRE